MLSEAQVSDLWERRIGAEVRSLYFGELASKYSKRKQIIAGCIFFLSSGAAGTLLGKLPTWVPLTLSLLVAALTAFTIATNLDVAIRAMAKFHYEWSELAYRYETLWNDIHYDDAQADYDALTRRERDLGELATTDAPNDQERLGFWQDYVLKQRYLVGA